MRYGDKYINKYTFIYYISGHRLEIGFSASSEPLFKVVSIRDTSDFFEDKQLTKKVWNKIKNLNNSNLIKLMLELDNRLGVNCMAFNHNA
jgi:hypothetical protein